MKRHPQQKPKIDISLLMLHVTRGLVWIWKGQTQVEAIGLYGMVGQVLSRRYEIVVGVFVCRLMQSRCPGWYFWLASTVRRQCLWMQFAWWRVNHVHCAVCHSAAIHHPAWPCTWAVVTSAQSSSWAGQCRWRHGGQDYVTSTSTLNAPLTSWTSPLTTTAAWWSVWQQWLAWSRLSRWYSCMSTVSHHLFVN